MDKLQNWFLHVDLDAFFASVEQLDHPEYRGKPLIVGGKPEDKRSVVSTASYEARKYGVHSAMPTSQAYKLCPNGIFVYGRMERYSQVSYSVMQILKNYSPDVDQMSIDEAFLDITGTEKLFGPPEITAQKIKEDIKKQTGLTVSIGLASSKYFAKIASDINKPDGFYFVKPGSEQEFMLNLPLKKVFGVGNKTLEKLNNFGIKKTKDIFEKSLETLTFMCGENQAQFLYNIVRGKCDEQKFNSKPKSHSISAETTFSYDVSDSYILETMILDLAYSIMFRLLKEKGFSKTAFIKIRYEDFSTVSVRQTFDKNIISLDNFYDILKSLFKKKWEYGRGVRLLGVGLDNIEKEDHPVQQELFDDGFEKKQKVEKAILQLSQKHPEIKVHKARMLQNIKSNFKSIILLLLFFSPFFSQKLSSQEKNDNKENKDFSYDINGFWQAGLNGNVLSTFANDTDFALSLPTPVFTQNVDLTADFSFAKWNLFTSFADSFNQNTYKVSYTGEKYLKKFVVSNRNIVFPSTYSSSKLNTFIGGGNNEAPGVLFHFEDYKNNKFNSDLVVRYDMTKSQNATFYGKNKVHELNYKPYDYNTNFFVIPKNITKIKDIYVQTDSNSHSPLYYQNALKFQKLNTSQYIIVKNSNLLCISPSVIKKIDNNPPKIMITFETQADFNEVIASLDLDSFDDKNTFLGELQSLFSTTSDSLSLEDYCYDYNTKIENQDALLIQNTKGFSPFLICSAYYVQNAENASFYVINDITKQTINDFSFSNTKLNLNSTFEDFFNTSFDVITVFDNNSSSSFLEAKNRYPFASLDPFIYLSKQNNYPLSIVKRSYSKVSDFDIGKNVDSGSINVLINGLPCHNFSYSHTSGFVTINQNILDTDRIDISYNEQANNAQNGTVSLAAAFNYNFTPNFSSDITLSSKIPFNPFYNYATQETNHKSYVSLDTGLNFQKESFSINNTLSLVLENPNISGTYAVSSLSKTENKTYYNAQNAGFDTKTVPKLERHITLEKNKQATSLSKKGENDSLISGYKIPLAWKFNENQNWAAIDIDLQQGELLCNSNRFEFALKNECSGTSYLSYKIYFQLGILASNEKDVLEENVPTFDITSQFDFSKKEFQLININLSEMDRSFLINQKQARLIVVKNKSDTSSLDDDFGKISFGPYEYHQKGIFTKASNNIFVYSSFEYAPSTTFSKNYFSNDFYADAVYWNINETSSLSPTDTKITTTSLFPQSSFLDYENINLDFAFITNSTETQSSQFSDDEQYLTLTLDNQENQIALNVELSYTQIKPFLDSNYHTLRINTKENKVYIDNTPLFTTLYINKKIVPTRQTICFNTQNSEQIITNGKFIQGALYYTNIESNIKLNNIFEVNYTQKNAILLKNEKTFIKDTNVLLKSNQNITTPLSTSETSYFTDFLLDGQTNIFNTNINTHILLEYSNASPFSLTNFGYNIKNELPYFSVITFQESFNFDKHSGASKKEDYININLLKINIPLETSFAALYDSVSNISQKYDTNILFSIPIKNTKLNSKTSLILSQNAQNTQNNQNNLQNHFISSLKNQFSTGFDDAKLRNAHIVQELSYNFNSHINPKLFLSLKSQTSNEQTQSFSNNNTFNFTFPFKIKTNSFNFTYEKKLNALYNESSLKNYNDDLSLLFKNQKNYTQFYRSIPFYELFDKNLFQNIEHQNITTLSYNTKYSFNWKRNLFSSVKDLYIPSSFTTTLTRDIINASNINDIYQIKSSLNYNFINLFGSKGTLHLFDFFTQDEYLSNITLLLKIPNNGSKTTFNLSFNESLLLYIDNDNTIKATSSFSISDKQNYQFSFSTLWSHSGKNSILIALPSIFYNKINDMQKKVSRKENFLISFGKQNDITKQEYKYSHGCDVNLNNNIDLSTNLTTAFNYTTDKALSLKIEYYIGAKLTLNYCNGAK